LGREHEREKGTAQEAVTAEPAPPRPVVQPMGGAQQVLAMQRSAGNHATAAALGAGRSGPVLARNPLSWFKKKLGKGKEPKVSGPKNARPMTPEEKGGILSMKELIEQFEETMKKPVLEGGDGGIIEKAIKQVGVLVGGGEGEKEEPAKEEEPPEAKEDEKQDEPDTTLEDTGDFFKALEAEIEAALEADRKADEDLYTQCKSLGLAMDSPSFKSGGVPAKVAHGLLKIAVAAWKASPRRQLNTPQDKARKQELDALVAEKMWIADAAESSGAAVEPNPEMKSTDKTGYFCDTKVPLQKVKPDGTLDAATVNFTKDVTLTTLVAATIDGKEGYTVKSGANTYWMPKDKVVVKTGKFEKVAGPLFPPDPEPAHVKQTTLGDCYLQAAVASVADKNPGLIKAMMRDNNDDSVTVRLYKVDDTDEKKHSFSAKYVRVEKSVPKNFEGQEIYNAGAIWVRLIEKAYAAGGFMGDTSKAAAPTKSYEGIAAGQARHAMEVLLGEEMKTQFLTGNDLQSSGNYGSHTESTGTQGTLVWSGRNMSSVPWDANEVTNHATAKTADQYDNLLSYKILGDKGKVDDWITFVKTDAIKNVFTAQQTKRAGGFAGQVTLEDIQAAMSTGLATGIRDTIMAWIEKQQLFPGALGSTKYSKFQLDVFRKIKETLENGGVVTGGTYKFPGTGTTGTGASGGEAVDKGMVGGHAFSIIGARALSTANADDPKPGDFYFIRIRNPWGKYGRKYDMSKGNDAGEAVEDGNGESWLELSDLTKFFETINYG
jgi:hypothetical protein